MSREIKFRAWDKVNNQFCTPNNHGDYIWQFDGDNNIIILSYNGNDYAPTDVIIEQFIGKIDKNKKEIYEHDIVIIGIDKENGNGRTVPVWIEYIDDMAKFIGFVLNTSECEDIDISELDDYELEIIGNIHENPELLK